MKLHGHELNIGDKVWDYFTREWVVVIKYVENTNVPFLIKSDNGIKYWRIERNLYWQPIAPKALEAAKQKPNEPEYEMITETAKEAGARAIADHNEITALRELNKELVEAFNELERALCAIKTIDFVDGHYLIRRDSVIDIARNRRDKAIKKESE